MLLLLWLGLCAIVFSFLLLLPALWRHDILRRYSGSRLVTCPQNQQNCLVAFDARRAADARMDGRSDLRLSDCTRWPESAKCDQACMPQALTESYTPVVRKGGKKPIYHLPIVLAAFAAWYVGAIWHSQYMFRARWMHDVGLTLPEIKRMVWWLSPHLLTVGVWLLFAYGVAWLLAVSHRKGVLHGVLMSLALCVALIATTSYAIARLPHDLFVIEWGYIALATLIVGAIVGGLYDKLVLPAE